MSHNKSTRAQKEYVRAVIHQLSLQRFSDTEISDYLAEKGIVLARCSVNGIKKQIEKQAEKWYIELKQSRYKYIATYKERLDSLLSYQKILHDMISTTKKEEIKIRAISELTSIEMNIFNLWKQLPDLDIVSKQLELEKGKEKEQRDPEAWPTPEEVEAESWVDTGTGTGTAVVTTTTTEPEITEQIPNLSVKIAENQNFDEEDKDGEWKQLQCPTCHKWFMNNFTLSAHTCIHQQTTS